METTCQRDGRECEKMEAERDRLRGALEISIKNVDQLRRELKWAKEEIEVHEGSLEQAHANGRERKDERDEAVAERDSLRLTVAKMDVELAMPIDASKDDVTKMVAKAGHKLVVEREEAVTALELLRENMRDMHGCSTSDVTAAVFGYGGWLHEVRAVLKRLDGGEGG